MPSRWQVVPEVSKGHCCPLCMPSLLYLTVVGLSDQRPSSLTPPKPQSHDTEGAQTLIKYSPCSYEYTGRSFAFWKCQEISI